MTASYRLGVIASTPRGAAARPLDAYTANLWAALDPLRRQLTSYAGNAIRVRRSSDSAEMDIGFVADVLDTTALASFVGAGTGYVKTIYDQSGNGNDFSQTTTTKQPVVTNAGTYNGKIVFDGSSQCMQSVNNSGTPGAISGFIKGALRGTTATQIMVELTTNTGSVVGENGLAYYNSNNTNKTQILQSAGTTYGQSNFSATITNNVHAFISDKSQSTIALEGRLWIAGTEFTPPTSTAGSITTGTFSAAKWNLGARNNGASLFAALDLYCLVLYEASKTATVGAISAAVA